MRPLQRLAQATQSAVEAGLARAGGEVVAVTPGLLRVAGLAPIVALGDLVGVETEDERNPALGEVIRIDPDAVLVKPFDRDEGAALGRAC